MGYIYIMTNPAIPEYVKIGYADNVEKRLKGMNKLTAVPFAFRVYATYEVDTKLTDKKVHEIIDKLNPDLRCVETINGKERKREFFAMKAEEAYGLLEAIAEINNFKNRLKKNPLSKEEKKAEEDASEIREKAQRLEFDSIGIKPGSTLEMWHKGKKLLECTVIDNTHVEYNGEVQSLSGIVKTILGKKNPPGPKYFKYNGEWINDMRRKEGLLNF